ncbi:leucine-rich repeat protein [Oscillospiraceae bacterium LCP25S3_E10]
MIMKRLLYILLVALMVFSFTATVYAAGNSGSSTINVAGEYSVASTGEVVSVDVGWEEMSFKYTEGEKQWDPGTHSYIGGENGGWSDNKPGITMTNHSNVDVVAELSFTPSASVTGTFYSKSGDTYTALSADEQGANMSAAAEGSEQSAADAKTFYFGISGGAITKNTTLGTITVSISFKPSFTEADLAAFTYTTDSYGRVKITGVKDTSVTELVVPDFVYEIECGALKDCTSLVKLTVPFAGNRSNGEYYTIGYAFGAKSYKQGGAVLPETLKDITVTGGYSHNETLKTNAFYNCFHLTNITIDKGVKKIEKGIFFDCISLESLTLPFVGEREENAPNYVFNWAFSNGSKNTDVMSHIGNTNALKYHLDAYYGRAFNSNSEIDYGFIPNSLKTVTIKSGVLPSYGFSGCKYIEKVVLEEGVTSIGKNCFQGCNSLSDVKFPSTIKEMYGQFKWTFYPSPFSTKLIEQAQAEGSDGFIYLNDTILAAYYGSEETVEIKEGTVTIADQAFSTSTNVKHIKCPESLRYVGLKSHLISYSYSTFPSTLESIELNEGLEVLGGGAFSDASNLTDITIPDSVKYVGYRAFENTGWLNNQPDGPVYAGKVLYTYKGTMPANTTFVVKDGTEVIADNALQNQSNLVVIDIPDSVTSIGYQAFSGDGNLADITLPKNLTHLGYQAFSGCNSISELTIPKSLKMLPDLSSESLPNLKLKFEEGSQLEVIASGALTCLGNQTVYLPAGVRYVEPYGLSNTTVMLPVEFCNVDLTEEGLSTSGTFLYMGTEAQAGGLTGVIYYSESEPESENNAYSGDTNYLGQYWHYDENGNPVLW